MILACGDSRRSFESDQLSCPTSAINVARKRVGWMAWLDLSYPNFVHDFRIRVAKRGGQSLAVPGKYLQCKLVILKKGYETGTVLTETRAERSRTRVNSTRLPYRGMCDRNIKAIVCVFDFRRRSTFE